ncbi:MAG TPA: GNAT family N-acyltransferase [Actinomycetota bacterium]|nr:GNAT family N-acyltransferase [Actinomycetota bacterium]
MTTDAWSDLDAVPEPRWLEEADDLARLLLERALPVRFALARTPPELEAAFRLRYRAVVEQGWRTAPDMPDGLERDEYDDDHAAQIVGWDGPVAVATARVVPPVPGRLLPTEAAFGIVAEPVGQVADAGRLIVAPESRDGTHRVLGGLAAAIWTTMAGLGFRWVAVAMTEGMASLCSALGFEVAVLGPTQEYWGEERFPARLTAPDPRAWR